MDLLFTAAAQSPLSTFVLNVAAVGWSNLQPASAMRTAAEVLRPMLVRCCPIRRTTSWSE